MRRRRVSASVYLSVCGASGSYFIFNHWVIWEFSCVFACVVEMLGCFFPPSPTTCKQMELFVVNTVIRADRAQNK